MVLVKQRPQLATGSPIEGQSLDERAYGLQADLQNLVKVLVAGLKRQLSPYGIDAVEYTVLSVCLAVGPTSIRDLRELVPIDYGHMSRTASRLEDKGLLQKVRLRDDRRLVRLSMTEEGVTLIPELVERVHEYYAHLVRDISHEQLLACMAVMQRMISAWEQGESHPDQAADSPGPPSNGGTRSQPIESLIGTLQSDVTRLVNVMYQGIKDALSPTGLAVGEYSVLTACLNNESITVSGLAEHVPLDVGRISRIVSKLEDRELILKVRPERDRRVVRVEVTEQGRALAIQLAGSVSEHYVNVVSKVREEELIDLITCIERMTANAETADGSPAGGSG